MSVEPPAPLVPAEVDLRGLEYMPLYGDRLFHSVSWKRATPEARCAMLRLWWHAFAHEVPAGSLPDDDALLADYAGYGDAVKPWLKIRDQALRHWRKCSDGRFYDPVSAEIVMQTWEARLAASARGKNGASKRWGSSKHPENIEQALVNDSASNAHAIKKNGKRSEVKGSEVKKAAARPVEDQRKLSTAHGANGAAAAHEFTFPEKLSAPDREAATELLQGVEGAQILLDELQGVIEGKKGCRDPMAMLVSFIRQKTAGQFAPSHAHRVQAEREGKQVTAEVEEAGRRQRAIDQALEAGDLETAIRLREEVDPPVEPRARVAGAGGAGSACG